VEPATSPRLYELVAIRAFLRGPGCPVTRCLGDPSLPMTPRTEYVLHEAALRFVGVAAFPRLAYRLRWPTRLGPRGLIGYIAFNTLLHFAIRQWLLPRLRRMAQERERSMDQLRRRLGCEPSRVELHEHLRSRVEG